MPFAIGAAIAGAASLAGSAISSSAASSAANTQAGASLAGSQAQINFEQQALSQATAQNAPYAAAGTPAVSELSSLLKPGGSAGFDLSTLPGFKFQMDQGTSAIENSGAARGTQLSGNTLQSLDQFGQGVASTNFNQYLSQIAGLTQIGQSSANNTATAAGNLLTTAGGAANQGIVGAGNAQAAGIVGSTNAITSPLNQQVNNWEQQQMLSQLLGQGGGWGSQVPYNNSNGAFTPIGGGPSS